MILDEIITHRKEQLAREKAKIGEGEMKKLAEKVLSERTPLSLAAALKNVVALACGVITGLGYQDNTKALLITRAMAETSRLAERLGGRKETLAGLAGMGDLIVTCTSMHSRNRRAGIAIGEGRMPQEVVADMGGVVEGYYAAVSAKELADSLGVEMPICEAMYDVLYNGAEVRGMVHRLMSRAPKRETDNGWV